MLTTLTNTSRIYKGSNVIEVSNSCFLIGSSSALIGDSGLQVSEPWQSAWAGGLGLHASSQWDGEEHGGPPIAIFMGHDADPQHSCP